MGRTFSALLVGLLSLSAAGVLDLALPEPCSASESAEIPSDGTCPQTCVRCHCARAFDLVLPVRAAGLVTPAPEWRPSSASLPLPIPHDILHVPKLALI